VFPRLAAAVAGEAALVVVVLAKLGRVVLLAPMGLGVGLVRRQAAEADRRPPLLPLFMVGFLAMVAVRATGVLPPSVLDGTAALGTLLLTGAMFGLGTAVHLPVLVRAGGRAALLGGVATALAGDGGAGLVIGR
jgi:uncharacterized membrane protein YadS